MSILRTATMHSKVPTKGFKNVFFCFIYQIKGHLKHSTAKLKMGVGFSINHAS